MLHIFRNIPFAFKIRNCENNVLIFFHIVSFLFQELHIFLIHWPYYLSGPTPDFTLKPVVNPAGSTSKENLPKVRLNLPCKWTILTWKSNLTLLNQTTKTTFKSLAGYQSISNQERITMNKDEAEAASDYWTKPQLHVRSTSN